MATESPNKKDSGATGEQGAGCEACRVGSGFIGTLKEHTRGLLMTSVCCQHFGLSRPLPRRRGKGPPGKPCRTNSGGREHCCRLRRPHRHKGALGGGRGFTEAGERNGYKETRVSCGLEAPLGSCVSPGAAFLTEFRCIFSTESARFALTLSVLGRGAAIFFFFS